MKSSQTEEHLPTPPYDVQLPQLVNRPSPVDEEIYAILKKDNYLEWKGPETMLININSSK
jgi:Fe-S cluster biosynthesis and repair protein YggX